MDFHVGGNMDKGAIGGLQHHTIANPSLQWPKDIPDNRHVLLRARNDLSSSVAQTVARSIHHHHHKAPPPPTPIMREEPTIPEERKMRESAPLPIAALPQPLVQPMLLLQPTAVPIISTPAPVLLPKNGKSNRKRGIPHIYRDFSNVPDTVGFIRKKTGGVTQPFPEKLHEMLDWANQPAIVTWLPHGRAFLVKKPKEFTDRIMPRYFRQTKLTSFQRQLNLYGFRRITQGPDAGAYYHELFLRGRPHLCMRMQRQKVKGTGHKQPADAQTEPNFYAMPPSQPKQQPAEISPPTLTTVPTAKACDELSPGLQGVHGAAQLLKTIAAGWPASTSSSSFSLGKQAIDTPQNVDLFNRTAEEKLTLAQQPSLSLLGRVTQAEPLVDAPSAFLWPPVHSSMEPPKTAPSLPRADWSRGFKPTFEPATEENRILPPPSNGRNRYLQSLDVMTRPLQFSKGEYSSVAPAITDQPKFNEYSHKTDLIENKIMRGIESEEA